MAPVMPLGNKHFTDGQTLSFFDSPCHLAGLSKVAHYAPGLKSDSLVWLLKDLLSQATLSLKACVTYFLGLELVAYNQP